jgi:flagellar biogenesis protein FliO
MKGIVAGSVIALALVATTVTRAARADPAPTSEEMSPPVAETPLHVRSSKPLELEPAVPPLAMGWKLSAIALALGCAGIWVWKRRTSRPLDVEIPEVRILRRTPIGVRSELLVIDFEGQRLLVGVTPHTIQNLFIMPPEAPAAGDDAAPVTFAGRLADVIDASDLVTPSPRSSTNTQASRDSRRMANDVPIEGQARGMIATREPK